MGALLPLLLVVHEPGVVLRLRGGGRLGRRSGAALLALDLDGHALVLLERGGEVGLLGRLGGLRLGEGGDVALGVGGLDGRRFVGLQLPEVELLDEVGCRGGRAVSGQGVWFWGLGLGISICYECKVLLE